MKVTIISKKTQIFHVTIHHFQIHKKSPHLKSQFIFRMKQDKYDGVSCAIFEADGGAWVNEAMKNIKEYLQFELVGFENFTVIA